MRSEGEQLIDDGTTVMFAVMVKEFFVEVALPTPLSVAMYCGGPEDTHVKRCVYNKEHAPSGGLGLGPAKSCPKSLTVEFGISE
jgi:hypothetical protein